MRRGTTQFKNEPATDRRAHFEQVVAKALAANPTINCRDPDAVGMEAIHARKKQKPKSEQTGNARSALNRWNVFKERIMMIKILEAKPVDDFRLRLEFSDAAIGIFDGRELLAKSGPLLEPLRDPAYFSRAFVDAGGLCWPNGLELSPQRLRAMVTVEEPHPV